MVAPTNHVVSRGSRHFGGFCNIFLTNIDINRPKSYQLSAGTLVYTVPFGKSGLGYCHIGGHKSVNPLLTKLTFSLTRYSVKKFFHVNGLK